ncbi:Transcription factor spt20 [Rhodotorula toruloides]|uniref:BY PROTMAP: gi/472584944/gb/EMS22519.1/ Spt20 family protein [Rhodosporidium toruloides NP11] gi/647400921/emb/CDR46776.1/ RHTO0S13e01574g1_1 [Rhodosporidium toruloides] n=1 Tax=Rhodotorula toruloides TaxID=5286 RepID=A0A0K3CRV2_RHOTO
MSSGATYNVTRFTRQVLKRHRRAPPSLVIHLYPTHFRFEHQHGNFAYDSPMKCFLEAVREQKLPTDLLEVLDESGVVYYDGCLIVEVHDHRDSAPASGASRASLSLSLSQARETPAMSRAEVYRIVLAPNPATLWTELGIMSRRMEQEAAAERREDTVGWTEEEALEVESVILNRTMPPLCLSPSMQTNRVANSMLRATTLRPPKRKRFCSSGDCEDDEDGEEGQKKEREEHEKLMKVGDEGVPRTKGPAFSRLAFIQAYRERQNNPTLAAQPGSSATSIRLGGASAAAAAAQGGPVPTPRGQSRAVSPAASTASGRPQKKKAGDGMSDSGSAIGGAINTAAQQKKAAQLAGQVQDPAERERAILEKKRIQQQQKRAQAARRKERKKQDQEQARLAGDLQVGTPGSSAAGTPTAWQ